MYMEIEVQIVFSEPYYLGLGQELESSPLTPALFPFSPPTASTGKKKLYRINHNFRQGETAHDENYRKLLDFYFINIVMGLIGFYS